MANNKNNPPNQDRLARDRLSHLLLALVGNKVVATVKGGLRYQGILAAATGDHELNLALRQAELLDSPNAAAVQPQMIIHARDLLELKALDVALEPPRSHNGAGAERDPDAFKTDTDITGLPNEGRREKELQAWGGGASSGAGGLGDNGIGGGLEDGGKRPWDQFAVNEKLYGTRTDYNEEFYTTKLDRSTPDYRAREQRAAQLEREILKGSSLSNNAHMAEERGGTVDDSNMDEEDRYSGVIRGPDAYIPPGARKAHLARFGPTAANGTSSPGPAGSTPPPVVNLPRIQEPTSTYASRAVSSPGPPSSSAAASTPSTSSQQQPAAPPLVKISTDTPKASSSSSSSSTSQAPPPSIAFDPQFRHFVSQEKERLSQKKNQVIKAAERKESDSRLASLLEFSQTFKLKTPIPDDIATMLGRDPNNKKKESVSTATSPVNSPIRPPRTLTPVVQPATKPTNTSAPSSSSSSTSTLKASTAPKIPIVPEIPPFNPNRRKVSATGNGEPTKPAEATATTSSATPASVVPAVAETKAAAAPPSLTASTSKISATAAPFVFKPNPNASAFTPSFGTSSPLRKPAELPVNPFFGTKAIKKGSSSMHVKEDFTPFKNGSVQDAVSIPQAWAFTGKPYSSIFPPTPPLPQQQQQPPQPPRPEDDPNLSIAHHLPPTAGGPPPPPPPQGYPIYQYQPQPQFNRFQPPPPMHLPPGGMQFQPYPGMPFPQLPPGAHVYQPTPQMPAQMPPQPPGGFIRYPAFPTPGGP